VSGIRVCVFIMLSGFFWPAQPSRERERLHPSFFVRVTQASEHVSKVNLVWYFVNSKFTFRSHFRHPPASV